MSLPAIREKLSSFSIRRKVLLLILGFLILFLLLIVAEVAYCLNSEICLLRIVSSYSPLGKVTGVKETASGFKKGNFTVDKHFDLITVSGEIVKVESDRLTLMFHGGSKKTVSVKNGSKFIVFKFVSDEESGNENHTFDGNNLRDFLSTGDYLGQAGFSGSEIFSEHSDNKGTLEFPIVVLRQLH